MNVVTKGYELESPKYNGIATCKGHQPHEGQTKVEARTERRN